MSTLVIGSGYLGSEIFYHLKDAGRIVHATKRSPMSVENSNEQTKYIQLDVLKPETFKDIPKDTSSIIYCVSPSDHTEESYKAVYHYGVFNILEFSKNYLPKISQFTLISSTGVYAENSGGSVAEDADLKSDDVLYRHVISGETQVLEYAEISGLVLRLSGIYGPGRNFLISMATKMTFEETVIPQWTNRIHKVDAASACLHLMDGKAKGIYNISDREPVLRRDVLMYIRSLLNLPIFQDIPDVEKSEVSACVTGKKCDSSRLVKSGFIFRYPTYREGYKSYL